MASLSGSQNRFVWEGAGAPPASTYWTTSVEPTSLPMYVVPQTLLLEHHVSPKDGPLPTKIPLPAFVKAPEDGPKENTSDYFSDTSSTTCPEDEFASKSASQVNLVKMPTSVSGSLGLADFANMPSAKTSRNQFASKPGSKKSCWQLVWCCERCNKAANAEIKNAFHNMAKMFAGSLHCLKKADKIKAHPAKGNYLLVSDWREAKPIVDIFAQEPSMTRPSVMLIICSTARSYENALQWVAKEGVVKAPSTHFEVFYGQNDIPDDPDVFFATMQRVIQSFASKPQVKAPVVKPAASSSASYAVSPMHPPGLMYAGMPMSFLL